MQDTGCIVCRVRQEFFALNGETLVRVVQTTRSALNGKYFPKFALGKGTHLGRDEGRDGKPFIVQRASKARVFRWTRGPIGCVSSYRRKRPSISVISWDRGYQLSYEGGTSASEQGNLSGHYSLRGGSSYAPLHSVDHRDNPPPALVVKIRQGTAQLPVL